jgi:polar amino acid transport system substrate-binding protein
VGTLAGTIAHEILLRAEREYGLHVVSYEDDVHPYSDLVIGRVDAVLLDNVLAERRHRAMTGFTIQPQTVAIGHYVGVLAAQNAALRDSFNEALRAAMRDGRLERILRTWSVWNDDQPKLYERILAGVRSRPSPASIRRRASRPSASGKRRALFPVAASGVAGHDRPRACRWPLRWRSACSSPSDGCTVGRSRAPACWRTSS